MKKLTLVLLIFIVTVTSSCRLSSIDGVGSGIKLISNCCKNIAAARCKTGCAFIPVEVKQEPEKSPSLLPVYTWDSKQMLW